MCDIKLDLVGGNVVKSTQNRVFWTTWIMDLSLPRIWACSLLIPMKLELLMEDLGTSDLSLLMEDLGTSDLSLLRPPPPQLELLMGDLGTSDLSLSWSSNHGVFRTKNPLKVPNLKIFQMVQCKNFILFVKIKLIACNSHTDMVSCHLQINLWDPQVSADIKQSLNLIILFYSLSTSILTLLVAESWCQNCSSGSKGTRGPCTPPGPVKISHIQECIPVGCVPSAAVAVCWGGVQFSPLWTDRHLWKHNLSATTVTDGKKMAVEDFMFLAPLHDR